MQARAPRYSMTSRLGYPYIWRNTMVATIQTRKGQGQQNMGEVNWCQLVREIRRIVGRYGMDVNA